VAEIKVNIIGDNGDLVKSLAQAEKELLGFEKALKNAVDPAEITRLNQAIQATKGQLAGLRNVTNNLGLKKVVAGANEAGQSLTNLGRIAQDAPFGFIGIQNNINPLIESFQRLKASTGTTGGALKALAASLGGAGGVGLAISVATGLLTVFSGSLFGSGKTAEEAKSAIDRYKDSVDSLKSSVDDVTQSIQFANQLGGLNVKIFGFGQDVGNEIQDLKEQSIAQDDAIAAAQNYVDQLRSVYLERVKGLSADSKDYLDITNQFNKDFQEAGEKQTEQVNKQRLIFRQIELQKLEDQKEVNDKAKAARDKALEANEKYVNETIKQAKRLADKLSDTTVRDVKFETNSYDTTLEQYRKAVAFLNKAQGREYVVNFKLRADLLDAGASLQKAVDFFARINPVPVIDAKTTAQINDEIAKIITEQSKRNPIVIAANVELGEFYDFKKRMEMAAQDLNNNLRDSFINAGVNLADAIGEGLAGGDFGAAIFGIIGDLVSQIGKAMISYGIAISGVQKALTAGLALPPGIIIALGAAAIAAGSLIKNTKIKARALGGPVNSNSPYLVGERGPELFVPNGSGRIVPNNGLNSGLRGIGGADGGVQEVIITGRLRGRDMRLQNARTSRSQRRLGAG